MEKDLTTGSVLKNIVFFSLPYLLSYFLQTLYGMADLFIIGQFDGVTSITAVSVGSQVMHMLTVMIVGLAMGATVTIGKAVGGKQMDQASLAVGNTVTLFMGVAGTVMIVLLLLVKPIVAVMSTPTAAVPGTITYLTICFIGIPFITAYNIISSIFRGLGDSKSPMYFIIVACGANILLDYLFIGGLHMGAAGAVGIVEKIIGVVFLVPSTMLSTVSALSAQNIGAGKHDRATGTLRYALLITVGYGIVVAIVMQFVSYHVVGLFTDDTVVVRLGDQYLRSYIWDTIFAGIHFSFSGYFCAYGLSAISFIHNVLSILCVRIPGAYLASVYYPDTLYPMGLAAPGGSLLSVLICVIAFVMMKKRRHV